MSAVLAVRRRRVRAGFSLIETMTASAIFLIAFVSLTSFVAMTANRRAAASKHSAMTRLAADEYQRLMQSGFDSLPVTASTTFNKKDPDGREARFNLFVSDNCNADSPDGGSIKTNNLVGTPSQACCTNNICCKALRLTMQWDDTSKPNRPQVSETYYGFVTKSCQ